MDPDLPTRSEFFPRQKKGFTLVLARNILLLSYLCSFFVPQKRGMINMWWSIFKLDVKEDLLTMFGSKSLEVAGPVAFWCAGKNDRPK